MDILCDMNFNGEKHFSFSLKMQRASTLRIWTGNWIVELSKIEMFRFSHYVTAELFL